MRHLLLHVAVALCVSTAPVAAQSSGAMNQKGDSTHAGMGMSDMGKGGMRKDPLGSAAMGMGKAHDAMAPKSHGMGATLTGVDGHRAGGGVSIMRVGPKATVTLDSTFSMSEANGAGLYLSMGAVFDMHAVRLGALQKAKGRQTYGARLPTAMSPEYLLIVHESTHAVMAKASLLDSVR